MAWWLKTLLSQTRWKGNFCSFAPTTVFPLNTNCLRAQVRAPSRRVTVVTAGILGNQSTSVGACEASEHTKLQHFHGRRKKKIEMKEEKKKPLLECTQLHTHTIIKSNGVRAFARKLLLLQFLPESHPRPHPRNIAANKAGFQSSHFPKEPSHTDRVA